MLLLLQIIPFSRYFSNNNPVIKVNIQLRLQQFYLNNFISTNYI